MEKREYTFSHASNHAGENGCTHTRIDLLWLSPLVARLCSACVTLALSDCRPCTTVYAATLPSLLYHPGAQDGGDTERVDLVLLRCHQG